MCASSQPINGHTCGLGAGHLDRAKCGSRWCREKPADDRQNSMQGEGVRGVDSLSEQGEGARVEAACLREFDISVRQSRPARVQRGRSTRQEPHSGSMRLMCHFANSMGDKKCITKTGDISLAAAATACCSVNLSSFRLTCPATSFHLPNCMDRANHTEDA